MSLSERLNSLPGGRWIVTIIGLCLLGGAWPIFDLYERIPKASLWILKQIVAADDAKLAKVEPSTTGQAIVIAIYIVVAVLVCVAIFFGASFRNKLEARYARKHGGQSTKDAAAMYRWLLKNATLLPYQESSVKRSLVIKKNYDVEFTDVTTLMADPSAPLFAIGVEIASDERLKDNDRCDFRVRSLTDGVNVLTVPAEETLGKSRYVLLFVPPLYATQKTGIVLETKTRWPKAARKLGNVGVPDDQTYLAKKRLAAPIDEVVFSVTVELDGEFTFEHEVEATDCQDCSVSGSGDRHYQVTAKDFQPKGDLAIRVTRRAKAAAQLKGE